MLTKLSQKHSTSHEKAKVKAIEAPKTEKTGKKK